MDIKNPSVRLPDLGVSRNSPSAGHFSNSDIQTNSRFCSEIVYDRWVEINSENALQIESATAAGRFAALLREPAGERANYDRPLLERPDWVVAPTLGAIVPNWLIVVPREPALNFRAWKKQFGKAPGKVLDDLREHLGITSTEIVWFEHGPAGPGTLVGCGADYAHLHFLIRPSFTFDAFAQQAISLSELEWKTATFDTAYEVLPDAESYLVAGSGDETIFTSHVELTGSQFFRRVVSLLSDRTGAWDYKNVAHADNIAQTIINFHILESATQRGG